MQADPEHIACWQRLCDNVTTSGHLEAADVDALAALGVRHVINLALTSHPQALPDERERLAERGIGYSHIPVPFNSPSDEHFAEFGAALAAAPRPIHVHCIMNWRVSAFFYRWHRDVAGVDESTARALMAQQWQPETYTGEEAPAWTAFICPRGSSSRR